MSDTTEKDGLFQKHFDAIYDKAIDHAISLVKAEASVWGWEDTSTMASFNRIIKALEKIKSVKDE